MPAKRRRLRRVARWSLSVIAIVAIIAALGAVWEVRRAFPQYDGTLNVPGLSAPVTVYRDKHADPAALREERRRPVHRAGLRHGAGTVLGDGLPPPRHERPPGRDVRRRARSHRRVPAHDGLARRRRAGVAPHLAAEPPVPTDYANGVNDYLAAALDGRRSSLEYSVLGLQNPDYRIAPWDPIDSLAWLKAMAWDLRGNMDDEIARAHAARVRTDPGAGRVALPGVPVRRRTSRSSDGGTRRQDGVFTTAPTADPAAHGDGPPQRRPIAGPAPSKALRADPDRCRRPARPRRQQLPGHRLELVGRSPAR